MNAADYFPTEYGDFCEFSQEYAEKHEKKMFFKPVGYLRCFGSKCAGYCEYDGNVTVATKHSMALPTFVHEFSHMTQQVDKHPLWDTDGIDDKIAPHIKSLSYLVKNGVSDWTAFYETMLLERDCERRAMRFIEAFELPLDLELYAQQANLYLFFYQYIYLRRKWQNSTKIYKPELVKLMPTKLVPPRELRKINMDIMAEYDNILQ